MLNVVSQVIARGNDRGRHSRAFGNQADERVHQIRHALKLRRNLAMPAHHERQAIVRAARAALDGHERAVHIALPQLIGAADAAELLNTHGVALDERQQRIVGHDPLARDVAPLSAVLTPGGKLARDTQLMAAARVDALDLAECLMAVGAVVRLVCQRAQLIEHPIHTAQLAQAAHHLGIGNDQILDVIDRILNLFIGQRTARPIGQRLGLGQRDAAKRLHERAVRNLLALAQKGGGDLRVKNRTRQHSYGMEHDLHILRAGMKYLDHALVGHKLGERRQVVDHQRIDRDALGRGGNLDQAQTRMERALAQKLGIDGNRVELAGALAKVE